MGLQLSVLYVLLGLVPLVAVARLPQVSLDDAPDRPGELVVCLEEPDRVCPLLHHLQGCGRCLGPVWREGVRITWGSSFSDLLAGVASDAALGASTCCGNVFELCVVFVLCFCCGVCVCVCVLSLIHI